MKPLALILFWCFALFVTLGTLRPSLFSWRHIYTMQGPVDAAVNWIIVGGLWGLWIKAALNCRRN